MIKNVILWTQPIRDNDSTQINISLIKAGFPPWDSDYKLGTIEFRLKNHNNKLNVQLIPGNHAKLIQQKKTMTEEQMEEQNAIQIINNQYKYLVVIELTEKATATHKSLNCCATA